MADAQRHHIAIYGAGGAIGGAVARAFAREGAKVFFAGRLTPGARSVRAGGRDRSAAPLNWRTGPRAARLRLPPYEAYCYRRDDVRVARRRLACAGWCACE